jgi:hypothetical protein
LTGKLRSVHVGHVNVGQDDPGGVFTEKGKRILAAVENLEIPSLQREQRVQKSSNRLFIIHSHNIVHSKTPSPATALFSLSIQYPKSFFLFLPLTQRFYPFYPEVASERLGEKAKIFSGKQIQEHKLRNVYNKEIML